MTLHCLVVDDAPAVRLAVRRTLTPLRSVEVDLAEASGVEEARERLADQTPDVVLLDIVLDGDDPQGAGSAVAFGQEVLERSPATALVLYTSLDRDDPRVDRLIALGAYAHLHKPVPPEELARLLETLARRSMGIRRIA